MPSLRHDIAGVSKNKRLKAIVIEVMKEKAVVCVASTARILRGLPIIGGPLSIGQQVWVDYSDGNPYVTAAGDSKPVVTTAASRPRVIVRDSEVNSTNGSSTGGGDMLKATYDTDSDGKVNDAALADSANGLRGRSVSADAPAGGDALIWDEASSSWKPGTFEGTGGVQPDDDNVWTGDNHFNSTFGMSVSAILTGSGPRTFTLPIDDTAGHHTYIVDATGGAVTINLPPALDVFGREYVFIKRDSSANAVVLDANGSETISGATTHTLSDQWDYLTIQSDGTKWYILSSPSASSGGAVKLDDNLPPDDNTDLNATTTAHGLLPKLSGNASEFLAGDGTWATPEGTGGSGGSGVTVTTKDLVTRTRESSLALDSTQASVTLTIPNGYDHIEIRMRLRCNDAGAAMSCLMAINGDTTAGNYFYLPHYSGEVHSATSNAVVNNRFIGYATSAAANANEFADNFVRLVSPKGTLFKKIYQDSEFGASNSSRYFNQAMTTWANTDAINTIVVAPESGSFVAGSIFEVIGIKEEAVVTGVSGGTEGYQKVLLYDQTLSTSGTFDLDNIPQTYDHLEIVLDARGTSANDNAYPTLTINADSTAGNYRTNIHRSGNVHSQYQDDASEFGLVPGGNATAGAFGLVRGFIPNYASTARRKLVDYKSVLRWTTDVETWEGAIEWESTNAITRLQVSYGGSDFAEHSRLQIFGLKDG